MIPMETLLFMGISLSEVSHLLNTQRGRAWDLVMFFQSDVVALLDFVSALDESGKNRLY
jgi:hypothetical protein